MEGFNIQLKIQTKTLAAVTQDDFSISAVLKESLTKEDKGAKKKVVVAHDVTFKVAGLVDLTKTPATRLNRDEILALVLATGTEAEVPFQYLCEGGQGYEGKAVITGYSESSGADGTADATYSLDLAVNGPLTKVGPVAV